MRGNIRLGMEEDEKYKENGEKYNGKNIHEEATSSNIIHKSSRICHSLWTPYLRPLNNFEIISLELQRLQRRPPINLKIYLITTITFLRIDNRGLLKKKIVTSVFPCILQRKQQ